MVSVRRWPRVHQTPWVGRRDHSLFTVPEELEAQSLPVSLSLSPSLVSATAEAEVLEQEALTKWCLRRRRPEHLERGLWSMAYSFAPSCSREIEIENRNAPRATICTPPPQSVFFNTCAYVQRYCLFNLFAVPYKYNGCLASILKLSNLYLFIKELSYKVILKRYNLCTFNFPVSYI